MATLRADTTTTKMGVHSEVPAMKKALLLLILFLLASHAQAGSVILEIYGRERIEVGPYSSYAYRRAWTYLDIPTDRLDNISYPQIYFETNGTSEPSVESAEIRIYLFNYKRTNLTDYPFVGELGSTTFYLGENSSIPIDFVKTSNLTTYPLGLMVLNLENTSLTIDLLVGLIDLENIPVTSFVHKTPILVFPVIVALIIGRRKLDGGSN